MATRRMAIRRFTQHALITGLLTTLGLGASSRLALAADQPGSPNAPLRIRQTIDETKMVSLTGNTHPLALPRYDRGPVADALPMEHIFVQLRRSPEQEQALQRYIAELEDPHSSNYQRWILADDLGKNFGPAQQDIAEVVGWLSSHGLQVNTVHPNGLTIDVSGTAGQVRETFHTQIHNYLVKGQAHIANASDPEIPAALAPVVAGVVSLHNFMPKPLLKKSFSFKCTGCPDGFDGTEQYNVAPPDFATIYNISPLYTASKPITGKGVSVVVLEDTDIDSADVATFRSAFGLSAYSGKFTQIHPGSGCSDPGKNSAEGEAALDAEWAGAAAPDANVYLASCADTATNFGAFIAAQNLLDHGTPPPIMSLSYLGCETSQGPGGNAYVGSLWQQAEVEGVSVFVASGDNGPAGCDDFDTAAYAVSGIAANGLASTPYNVATGGTDFLDTSENANSTYWNTGNKPNGKSAKSYIPETPWNDSCAGSVLYQFFGYTSGVAFCNSVDGASLLDIVGGSGAPSFVYAQPSWQTGIAGMPANKGRNLPDISLFASSGFWSHAIQFCMSDVKQGGTPCDYSKPVDAFYNSAGGTSFTAPQFAGIQALIVQKAGRQGNPNPVFYKLARAEYGTTTDPNTAGLAECNASKGTGGSTACIFHDVTVGNNSVPCYGAASCFEPSALEYGVLSTSDGVLNTAYVAHKGWDFTTGLGSVNVTNLVNNWP
ncbi:putative periplasmic aspartyl protease [Acidisarcina polymorpha]|uniref:Putative periplasmic aspartyl protease n=1 Tax=Acidisarcina polymorpha TaxID=2211140 RepID=A0A2Z5FVQ4_9BACT|nr:S53 family peptidase [Acidisarcina polymorpha]AXC10931.1 putative periplasmic aspartyl protease [Acidisarcina polymorpha]